MATNSDPTGSAELFQQLAIVNGMMQGHVGSAGALFAGVTDVDAGAEFTVAAAHVDTHTLTYGSLTIEANGSYTYALNNPNPDVTQTDDYTYVIEDNQGEPNNVTGNMDGTLNSVIVVSGLGDDLDGSYTLLQYPDTTLQRRYYKGHWQRFGGTDVGTVELMYQQYRAAIGATTKDRWLFEKTIQEGTERTRRILAIATHTTIAPTEVESWQRYTGTNDALQAYGDPITPKSMGVMSRTLKIIFPRELDIATWLPVNNYVVAEQTGNATVARIVPHPSGRTFTYSIGAGSVKLTADTAAAPENAGEEMFEIVTIADPDSPDETLSFLRLTANARAYYDGVGTDTSPSYTAVINGRAVDDASGDVYFYSSSLSVQVAGNNKPTAILVGGGVSGTVREGVVADAVGVLTAVDDAGQLHTFEIVGGADAEMFEITGSVNFQYTLKLRADQAAELLDQLNVSDADFDALRAGTANSWSLLEQSRFADLAAAKAAAAAAVGASVALQKAAFEALLEMRPAKTYVVEVKATDIDAIPRSFTQQVVVGVTNTNDAPSFELEPLANWTVLEGFAGAVVAQLTTKDDDFAQGIDSETLTYSMEAGTSLIPAGLPDAGQPVFVVAASTSTSQGSTHTLRLRDGFAGALNQFTNDTMRAVIKVQDNSGASFTKTVLVSITDVNQIPEFSPAAFAIKQGDQVVGRLVASDQDASQEHVFAIVTDLNDVADYVDDAFALGPNHGLFEVVTVQPAVPAESTFDLDTALARAADDDAATNTNADGSAKTPAEKKADFEGRTEMIGVAPLSAEAWDALRTGKAVHTLQFKGATRAAANQTYTVTVKVSDVGPPGPSRTYVQNVAISSRDMNEPPTNIALSNASVVEYFPDASVGDLAVSGDPEPLDTHALTIVTTGDDIGADHAMFAIAETQHAPAVPANSRFADLDAAKAGAAGAADATAFNALDEMRQHSISDADFEALRGETATELPASIVGAGFADLADATTAAQAAEGDDTAAQKANFEALDAMKAAGAITANAFRALQLGRVYTTYALTLAEGVKAVHATKTALEVTLRATDSDSLALGDGPKSLDQTFTIAVQEIALSSLSVDENTLAIGTLSVAGRTAAFATSNAAFAINGAQLSLASAADYETAVLPPAVSGDLNGTLVVAGLGDLDGSYAKDGGNITNGKPHYDRTAGSLRIHYVGGQWMIADTRNVVYATGQDVADPTLVTAWQIVGGALVEKDEWPNYQRTVNVTATVGGVVSRAKTFTVTLEDVNEAPSIVSIGGTAATDIALSVDEGETGEFAIVASDPDAGTTFTNASFTLSGENAAKFEVVGGASSKLSLKSGAVFTESPYTATVTVSDGSLNGAAVNVTLNVNRSASNTAPTISAPGSLTILEGATSKDFTFTAAADAHGDAYEWSLRNAETNNVYAGNDFAITASAIGSCTVRLTSSSFGTTYAARLKITETGVAAGVPGGSQTSFLDFSVTVTNDWAPPTAIAFSGATGAAATATTIAEKAAVGTLVGAVLVTTDPDINQGVNETFGYTIVSQSAGNYFAIDGDQIKLANEAPDFEDPTKRSLTLTVRATSEQNSAHYVEQAFTVSVTDVDEHAPSAPQFSNAGYPTSINEENTSAVEVGKFSGSEDTDGTNNSVTYVLVSGSRFFSVNASTGVLSVVQGVSYEDASMPVSKQITASVKAVSGERESQPVSSSAVTVVNVAEIPSDPETKSNTGSITTLPENSDKTLVRTFAATDNDGDTVTFSLETGGNSFELNATTGELFVNAKINYEALPASKTITATVKASTTVDGTVVKSANAASHSVTITDEDDAPSAPQYAPTANSVNENNTSAVAVGSFTATDEDDDAITFHKVADAEGTQSDEFALTAEGALSVVIGQDRETNATIAVDVVARSNGVDSAPTRVTIDINNVDERPNDPTLNQTVSSVNENTAETAVATLTGSTDPDGEAVTYTLESGGDYFTLNGATLSVKKLNFETLTNPLVTATVKAQGGTGLKSANAVTCNVTIGNVDDAPTTPALSSGFRTNVDEDAGTTTLGTLTSTDEDGDTPITFHIEGTAGKFSVDASSGTVSVDNLNAEEDGDAVSVQVIAKANGVDSTPRTITVDIGDVDDYAPTAPQPASASTAGVTLSGTTFTVPEGTGNLALATLSSTDADTTNNTVTFSVSDTANFSVSGTALTMTGTRVYGTNYASVTLTATSGPANATRSSTSTFSVTVRDSTDDTPTAITLSATTFPESTTAGAKVADITVIETDDQAARNGHAFALGGTDAAKFVVGGTGTDIGGTTYYTAPELRLVSAVSFESFATEATRTFHFTLTATDTAGQSTGAVALSMRVTDVNEAPSQPEFAQAAGVSLSVPENHAYSVGNPLALGTLAGSEDPEGNTVTYVTSNATNFAIDASTTPATLNFIGGTGSTDYESATSVTTNITAEDGTGHISAATAVTVQITDENDTNPVISISNTSASNTSATLSLNERLEMNTISWTLQATDADTTPNPSNFTWSKVAGGDTSNFTLSATGATATVTGSGTAELGQNKSVTIQVSDSVNTATQTLSITVIDVDDKPTNVALSSTKIPERSAAGSSVGTITVTDDAITAGGYTYALGGTNASKFEIDGSTLKTKEVMGVGGTTYGITIEATADAGSTGPIAFTITTTGIDDTPGTMNFTRGDVVQTAPLSLSLAEATNHGDVGTITVATPDMKGDPAAADVHTFEIVSQLDDASATVDYFSIANAGGTGTLSCDLSGADFEEFTDDQKTVTLTVRAVDEANNTNAASDNLVLTLSIVNKGETPTIGAGVVARAVAESDNATITATGNLVATDVDAGATITWSIVAPNSSTHGTLAIAPATAQTSPANATWTYTLVTRDFGSTANGDASLTETFTVRATDNSNLATEQTITVTIALTNDLPVVSAPTTGTITAGTASISSAPPHLQATDEESAAAGAQTASSDFTWKVRVADSGAVYAASASSAYGTLVMDGTTKGKWTYTLNNDAAVVKAIDPDVIYNDNFQVVAIDADGGQSASQTLTIHITGRNDAPTLDLSAFGGALLLPEVTPGHVVGTLTSAAHATDPDAVSDTAFTFDLGADTAALDNELFEVVGVQADVNTVTKVDVVTAAAMPAGSTFADLATARAAANGAGVDLAAFNELDAMAGDDLGEDAFAALQSNSPILAVRFTYASGTPKAWGADVADWAAPNVQTTTLDSYEYLTSVAYVQDGAMTYLKLGTNRDAGRVAVGPAPVGTPAAFSTPGDALTELSEQTGASNWPNIAAGNGPVFTRAQQAGAALKLKPDVEIATDQVGATVQTRTVSIKATDDGGLSSPDVALTLTVVNANEAPLPVSIPVGVLYAVERVPGFRVATLAVPGDTDDIDFLAANQTYAEQSLLGTTVGAGQGFDERVAAVANLLEAIAQTDDDAADGWNGTKAAVVAYVQGKDFSNGKSLDKLRLDAFNADEQMEDAADATMAAFLDFARAATSTADIPNGYVMSAAEQNAQKVAQVYAKATQLRAAYPTDALTVTAEQFETIKNGTDITLEQFNALPEMSDEDHDHGHDHELTETEFNALRTNADVNDLDADLVTKLELGEEGRFADAAAAVAAAKQKFASTIEVEGAFFTDAAAATVAAQGKDLDAFNALSQMATPALAAFNALLTDETIDAAKLATFAEDTSFAASTIPATYPYAAWNAAAVRASVEALAAAADATARPDRASPLKDKAGADLTITVEMLAGEGQLYAMRLATSRFPVQDTVALRVKAGTPGAELFEVNAANELRVRAAPFEGLAFAAGAAPLAVVVESFDAAGLTAEAELSVIVVSKNNNPYNVRVMKPGMSTLAVGNETAQAALPAADGAYAPDALVVPEKWPEFVVGEIRWDELDAEDVGHAVTLSGAGAYNFEAVQAANGVWSLKLKAGVNLDFDPNAAAVFDVTITVTDQGGLKGEQAFQITVVNLNEITAGGILITPTGGSATALATTMTASTTLTVPEHTQTAVVLGVLSSTDPDIPDGIADASLTFAVEGGLAGLFTIDAYNNLTINFAANAKATLGNTYSATIVITDTQGGTVATATQAFQVGVANANDAPEALELSSNSIDENSAAGATVGTVSVSDHNLVGAGDANDTYTFSLVDGQGDDNNGDFSIHASTGNLTKNAATTDYDAPETKPSYRVRVQAKDQGELTVAETFDIHVADVNEAPSAPTLTYNSGEVTSVTVSEGPSGAISAASPFVMGTLSSTDADADDTAAVTFSTSTAGFDILNGNTLRRTAEVDYETAASHTVTVTASSGTGDRVLTQNSTFTLTVTNVADELALQFGAGGDSATLTEPAADAANQQPTATGTITITDADTDDFAVSAWSVEPSLTTDAENAYYGTMTIAKASGSNNGVWTYTLDANVALGAGESVVETYTATATTNDASGSFTGNANPTKTIQITINGSNDGPTIGANNAATVAAGSTSASGTITHTDPDTKAGAKYEIKKADNTWGGAGTVVDGDYGAITLTDGSTGAYSYALVATKTAYAALAAGVEATDTFDVRVVDAGGLVSEGTVDVTVTGVNNAPVATYTTASADHTATEGGGTMNGQLTATDADTGATLTYSVKDGSAVDGATIEEDGVWSFDASHATYNSIAKDATRDVTIAYTVSDGETSSDGSFVITLTGTNDAPTATFSTAQQATEGGTTITGTLTATDLDGDTVTFAATNNPAIAGLTINADGTFTFDPTNSAYNGLAGGATQVLTVTYRATDAHGATGDGSFTITLTGTNDTATLSATSVLTKTDLAEETATFDGQIVVVDPDTDYAAAEITASIAAGATQTLGTFAVDSAPTKSGTETYTWGWTYTSTATQLVARKALKNTNNVDFATVTFSDTDALADREIRVTIEAEDDGPTFATAETTASTTSTSGASGSFPVTTDPEGDAVTYTPTDVQNGTYGALTVTAAGAWSYSTANNANFTALGDGVQAVDSFEVTATSSGGTATHTLKITAVGVNDAAVITGTTASMASDATSATGTVAHGDPDSNHGYGTAAFSGKSDTYGAFSTTDSSNLWTYTLAAAGTAKHDALLAQGAGSVTETMTFTFTSTTGSPELTGTVTLTIDTVDDAPIIVNSSATGAVNENQSTTGSFMTGFGTADALIKDADDTAFTWSIVGGSGTGDYGTLAVTAATGAWTYTTDAAATDALDAGDEVTDAFSIQASDGTSTVDGLTLTVTITGTDDGVSVSGSVAQSIDATRTTDVTGNLTVDDLDADATSATVSVSTQGTYGTLSVSAASIDLPANDLTWTYALDADHDEVQGRDASEEDLTDNMVVTITPNAGTVMTQAITITIAGVAAAATITQSAYDFTTTIAEGGAATSTGIFHVTDTNRLAAGHFKIMSSGDIDAAKTAFLARPEMEGIEISDQYLGIYMTDLFEGDETRKMMAAEAIHYESRISSFDGFADVNAVLDAAQEELDNIKSLVWAADGTYGRLSFEEGTTYTSAQLNNDAGANAANPTFVYAQQQDGVTPEPHSAFASLADAQLVAQSVATKAEFEAHAKMSAPVYLGDAAFAALQAVPAGSTIYVTGVAEEDDGEGGKTHRFTFSRSNTPGASESLTLLRGATYIFRDALAEETQINLGTVTVAADATQLAYNDERPYNSIQGTLATVAGPAEIPVSSGYATLAAAHAAAAAVADRAAFQSLAEMRLRITVTDAQFAALQANGAAAPWTYTRGVTEAQKQAVAALASGETATEVFTTVWTDTSNGAQTEQELTITVEGANSSVTAIGVPGAFLVEGTYPAQTNTFVGALRATDDDARNTHTFAFPTTDIQGSNGVATTSFDLSAIVDADKILYTVNGSTTAYASLAELGAVNGVTVDADAKTVTASQGASISLEHESGSTTAIAGTDRDATTSFAVSADGSTTDKILYTTADGSTTAYASLAELGEVNGVTVEGDVVTAPLGASITLQHLAGDTALFEISQSQGYTASFHAQDSKSNKVQVVQSASGDYIQPPALLYLKAGTTLSAADKPDGLSVTLRCCDYQVVNGTNTLQAHQDIEFKVPVRAWTLTNNTVTEEVEGATVGVFTIAGDEGYSPSIVPELTGITQNSPMDFNSGSTLSPFSSFTFTVPAASDFAVGAGSSTLTLKDGTKLNHEAADTVSVDVTVSFVGISATKTFEVAVVDADDDVTGIAYKLLDYNENVANAQIATLSLIDEDVAAASGATALTDISA